MEPILLMGMVQNDSCSGIRRSAPTFVVVISKALVVVVLENRIEPIHVSLTITTTTRIDSVTLN